MRNRAGKFLSTLCFLLLPYPLLAEGIDGVQLLEKIDNLYQQENAHASMTMEIETKDFSRSVSLDSWAIGLDYSLVKVTAPKKEQGIATLKRENEMWNYLPKINKVIKVPPSMMMGSWMGSDFTNDDLMREGSWVDEFDVTLSETGNLYQLDLLAKENTVTVWGRMQILVEKHSLLPVRQIYFDEDGTAMREMTFSEVKTFDGVTLPTVLELVPLNKEGNKTRVVYESMAFDIDLDEDFFSLQNLKKRR
ncbi:outer membrane lipoprotein-sorting protein [Reinekea marinisedimentorum]|uniref:Outer membrane lipoprotein-sorting protein n=1 Tax=Reinekea marinisedimentorum TaxID=230495 RepID=A0A4R3I5W5_9GAMM|nr:outer membrane lipoprotein-sorting protein [Reinekea marinisedimentorum]TCS41407.1 outer membrane lipoprotein-sorting protein [Reinekea marinisedimentorum]